MLSQKNFQQYNTAGNFFVITINLNLKQDNLVRLNVMIVSKTQTQLKSCAGQL